MSRLTVEHLGKSFTLARKAQADDGRATWRRWVDRARGRGDGEEAREFWALKDVSFDVSPGTVLGIVGANGAGKSTLLKVLARITTPTTGRVAGSGRVVSLLELGGGFNPELSARENIVMHAAMNGISKGDALARTPEILAFAEIEQFADQPVKHYSSGMYLRLAFSVAINMDPKILLADEILAVGDQAFQERCLQRVEDSGRRGLIVLFVSHDMEAIMRVCNQALWLSGGSMMRLGDPDDVVGEYQDAIWSTVGASSSEKGRQESRFARILGVKLLASDGRDIGAAPMEEDVYISIEIEAFKQVSIKGEIDLFARNQFLFRSAATEYLWLPEAGLYSLRMRIPAHLLGELQYQVTASITTVRPEQLREYRLVTYKALSFMAYRGEAASGTEKKTRLRTGLLAPRFDWSVEERHVERG